MGKLMDNMMGMMISRMSKKEKEEMMMKMMPQMMEGMDMAEVMPKMMTEMMKSISLDDLFRILKKLFPKILKGVSSLSEAIPKLMKAMPKFMEKMMPVMMKMMPHCLDAMYPHMPKEKRVNFAVTMIDSLVGQEGSTGISAEERQEIKAEIAKRIEA